MGNSPEDEITVEPKVPGFMVAMSPV